MGVIPIGRLAGKGVHGVVPVGEAGLFQSPLLGAALNEVLEQGDRVAENILRAFRSQDKGIVSPQIHIPPAKIINDRLQLLLVQPLLDGTLSSFDRLVHFLEEVGPSCSYRLFGTQLRWADAPTLIKAAAKYRLMM